MCFFSHHRWIYFAIESIFRSYTWFRMLKTKNSSMKNNVHRTYNSNEWWCIQQTLFIKIQKILHCREGFITDFVDGFRCFMSDIDNIMTHFQIFSKRIRLNEVTNIQNDSYLTQRTKSPLIVLLGRTRNVPSDWLCKVLIASSRVNSSKSQLRENQLTIHFRSITSSSTHLSSSAALKLAVGEVTVNDFWPITSFIPCNQSRIDLLTQWSHSFSSLTK